MQILMSTGMIIAWVIFGIFDIIAIVTGISHMKKSRKIQIVEVLKFNVTEYNALRTNLIFDETDV